MRFSSARALVALAAATAATLMLAPPAAATTFTPGAADVGDPLAPGMGNGGYDVSHYGIDLDYRPGTGVLTGTTTVTATTTQDLSRFDLDFALPATSVTVDGVAATWTSVDGPPYSGNRDLVVTPATGIRRGRTMAVVVTYRTEPASVVLDGTSEWSPTPTGVAVWDEPNAAGQWWFPGNDHPSDKAAYDVTVRTPAAYTATSNGRLVSRTVTGSDAVSHWHSDSLSSHVTLLVIGRYDVTTTTAGRIPVDLSYERGLGVLGTRAQADLAKTPQVLAFLQDRWGPYPFDAAGGVVVGQPHASSLETQGRPVYQSGLWQNAVDNTWVVVHENSHQWFGDDVTFATWSDIWLAEGFATYNEWIWSEHQHQGTAQQLFLATYRQQSAVPDFWTEPLDRPFYPLDTPVYQRGAMLLQALHTRIGDAAFSALVRRWLAEHHDGTATTADFEALATTVSGRDLTSFFHAWVDGRRPPAPTVANGFPPSGAGAATDPAPASLAAIERSDAAVARGAASP